MLKRFLIRLLVYGFLLMAACVVGYNLGSSLVNDVVVRGRVVTDDGRPLAHEELELIVPATYGLSASERGNPSRFGHETRPETLAGTSLKIGSPPPWSCVMNRPWSTSG